MAQPLLAVRFCTMAQYHEATHLSCLPGLYSHLLGLLRGIKCLISFLTSLNSLTRRHSRTTCRVPGLNLRHLSKVVPMWAKSTPLAMRKRWYRFTTSIDSRSGESPRFHS